MATKKTPPAEIVLTPAQVLRLQRASAQVQMLEVAYAGPLQELREADALRREEYRKVFEAAGAQQNGAKWEIVEAGDEVRLVRVDT